MRQRPLCPGSSDLAGKMQEVLALRELPQQSQARWAVSRQCLQFQQDRLALQGSVQLLPLSCRVLACSPSGPRSSAQSLHPGSASCRLLPCLVRLLVTVDTDVAYCPPALTYAPVLLLPHPLSCFTCPFGCLGLQLAVSWV